MQNRVDRCVIVRDYGKVIYRASSQAAMLAALEGCIEECGTPGDLSKHFRQN